MDLSVLWQDTLALGPISIVSLVGLIVLVVEALNTKTETVTCWISLAGLATAIVVSVNSIGASCTAFSGMANGGGYSAFFAAVFSLAGLLTVMLSKSYIKKEGMEHGEYYGILLFAVVGMMLMAAAADLVVLFLGLEIMSVSFYILAGFARDEQ
jgi:NADH-quinone oxidoreductase subunit N